ncbi:hypothetical protein EBR56_02405 [bacterium]|nr:hypothetical protein [bacterium]
MPATRAWPWRAVFFGLLALIGCGRRDIGATASGRVTIDGQPAPAGLRLDFQPQGSGGSPSTGVTDAAGRYELWFTAAHKGVMPGECRVMLQPGRESGPDGHPRIPEALKALRLPEAYAGDRSPLLRTVKPGHNTIDISLQTP